jgi:hypothetical protein
MREGGFLAWLVSKEARVVKSSSLGLCKWVVTVQMLEEHG